MSTAAEKIQQKLEELTQKVEERGAEVQVLKQELARVQARGARPDLGGGETRSIGRQIIESDQFKRMIERGAKSCDKIEIDAVAFRRAMRATSLSSSNVGDLVDNPLQPGTSDIAQRRPMLKDMMAVSPIGTDTVRYVKESGFYDVYTELALAAAIADTVLKVKYAGGFKSGATLKIASGVSEESFTISSIDYDKNEITLDAGLAGAHAIGVQVTSDEFIYTEETEIKPRAKWDYDEQTEAVKTLAVGIAVSDQVLEDAPRLERLINEKLPRACARAEESQILNGDGTTKQLSGILNDADLQTIVWSAQASGTTKLDLIRLGMHLAILSHYEPTTLVLHPQECRDIDLLKDDQGRYILLQIPTSEGVTRVWRMNIVQSTAIAAGTGLLGSFDEGAVLYERSSVSVRIFDQHEDFAERNMLYVRAELREALVVERGESFVELDFDAAP